MRCPGAPRRRHQAVRRPEGERFCPGPRRQARGPRAHRRRHSRRSPGHALNLPAKQRNPSMGPRTFLLDTRGGGREDGRLKTHVICAHWVSEDSRRKSMRKIHLAVAALVVLGVLGTTWMAVAQAQTGERFGLGTFTYQNRTFVGLVMRYPVEPQQIGGVVVELAPAAKAANVTGIPNDLLAIMDQWSTVGPRIKQIVAQVGPTLDARRPAYVYDYKAVDARAPFLPRVAFYGFSNYRPVPGTPPPATAPKMQPSMPGVWERAANDDRPMNPRLFLIPTTPEIFIGDGDPVINWHADRRKQYEYECELLGVVGRPMRRVPVDQVKNYMFGYANTNDISDRQARQPDNVPQDWLVQKGWDSMKPIGPFVVPQEFVDPLNMPLKMTVAGTLVQDSNTNQTWHSMYEYAAYLSNMLTLPVGTVIGLGTPPGSHGGLGRSLMPGDVQVCSYEGLGTLTNTLISEGASRTSSSR